MPSIDLNSINFETGSWEIPPDQAAKLQAIADGLNRAIARNPREVFLIEGHTDAVGNDVDNLSLSDRRAQSAAELLTQQFGVPAENLTSQGYGSAISEGADRRAEPHQPARHHPPHHAVAQWRTRRRCRRRRQASRRRGSGRHLRDENGREQSRPFFYPSSASGEAPCNHACAGLRMLRERAGRARAFSSCRYRA